MVLSLADKAVTTLSHRETQVIQRAGRTVGNHHGTVPKYSAMGGGKGGKGKGPDGKQGKGPRQQSPARRVLINESRNETFTTAELDENEDILIGPKLPHWSCHCGRSSNWACRVKCLCGREAPWAVLREAKKNRYTAQQVEQRRNGKNTEPRQRARSPARALPPALKQSAGQAKAEQARAKESKQLQQKLGEQNKLVKNLQEQVTKLNEMLRAKAEQQQDEDGMDTENETDTEETPEQRREIALAEVRSVQKMLQCNPADDLKEQLEQRLEKAKQDAARFTPGRYQLQTANRKLERNLKAMQAAKKELDAMEAEQVALTKRFQQKRVLLESMQAKHEAITEELMQASRKTFEQSPHGKQVLDDAEVPASLKQDPKLHDILCHPQARTLMAAVVAECRKSQPQDEASEGGELSEEAFQKFRTAVFNLETRQEMDAALKEGGYVRSSPAKAMRQRNSPYDYPPSPCRRDLQFQDTFGEEHPVPEGEGDLLQEDAAAVPAGAANTSE